MKNQKKDNDIEELIRDKYKSFSKGEKQVAKFILENYDNVVLFSNSEIAKKSKVSDTTVIRFTKSLGFEGFRDFKKALRANIHVSHLYKNLQDMKPNLSEKYADQYIVSTVKDLSEFVQHVDYELINDVTNLILRADRVYIGGLGTDSCVAKFLYASMRKIGFNPVLLIEEGHTLRESLLNVTKRDVLITCNLPKMFKGEIEMTKIAKEKGAKIVTITDSEVTAFELTSDYVIAYKETRKAFFNSYVIPMAICNLILLKIYEFSPDQVDNSLKQYTKMINLPVELD